jgi:hypothetical protein
MAEPALDRPGVVPLVGEGVAAGVPQHVRVGLELKAGASGRSLDHPGEAGRGERRAALADEDEGRRRGLAMQPAQSAELVALDRVGAWGAVLDPSDVEHGAVEIDLVPAQVADLGGPQAVPVGQQIMVASR